MALGKRNNNAKTQPRYGATGTGSGRMQPLDSACWDLCRHPFIIIIRWKIEENTSYTVHRWWDSCIFYLPYVNNHWDAVGEVIACHRELNSWSEISPETMLLLVSNLCAAHGRDEIRRSAIQWSWFLSPFPYGPSVFPTTTNTLDGVHVFGFVAAPFHYFEGFGIWAFDAHHSSCRWFCYYSESFLSWYSWRILSF